MKVLIATGGSGGHIFPALQTALQLRDRGIDIVFAGALSLARSKIQAEGFDCHVIEAHGFNDCSVPGIYRFIKSMGTAFKRSLAIVRMYAPDKVIGFGGYGSFPVVLAACFLRYPVMIHEQNVVPGKANRILAVLAKKVALTFKDSVPMFGKKAVWVGCPCHDQTSQSSRQDICLKFGLKSDAHVIALLGGSQGSQYLNNVFFEAMKVLGHRNIQAVHMTGKAEYEQYVQKYAQVQLPVMVSAFISPIEELYAIVDVVVARAGAATVCELGSLGIASVLIPYPFAGGHQRYNAQVLSKAGAAILIDQKDLDVQTLVNAIGQYLDDYSREKLRSKTENLFIKDAAFQLAQAVEEL